MKMFKILMIVVVIVGCASVSVGAENEDDSIFAKMWSKAMPKLEQALELFERGETLPESKIFGADKQSNNAKYEKLLNEVFDILLDSEFHASRGEYRSLEERIEKSEQKIAELRKERIGAPEESWIPFRQTRSKIDEEVDELKEDIARFRKEKEAIRSSM
ncbi:MAG: hypothetical protein CVV55_06830, partial [Synergistetes bacterium HGW-Synergistetes-2]